MSIVKALLSESHVYEYYGDRFRFFLGDLARWDEDQSGCRKGAEVSFTIELGNNIGDFDEEHRGPPEEGNHWGKIIDKDHYLTRGFSLVLVRWGVAFHWRGRQIDPEVWDIPRWKLDRKTGQLLPEWAD